MTDIEKLEIQVPIPQRMVTDENRQRLAAAAAAAATRAVLDALITEETDNGGPGSTVNHEDAAENVLMKTRCKETVDLWRGEVERLQACIKAEVDKHFKVQDKHGQENAGPPYCAADNLIWPCPIQKRMGEALFASYQARWMSGLFPEETP